MQLNSIKLGLSWNVSTNYDKYVCESAQIAARAHWWQCLDMTLRQKMAERKSRNSEAPQPFYWFSVGNIDCTPGIFGPTLGAIPRNVRWVL